MTTSEIATRLVDLCRKGDWEKAQKELYADNAISIEPQATPAFEKETKGLERIVEKGRLFDSMMKELHSVETSEPLVTANAIAFTLTMDITMKERGREKWNELCVYEVKDGKIVSEHFYM